MFKINLFIAGLLMFFYSCKMDKKVDRSAYEEELENREPVRVTEAELFSEALKLGDEITKQAQQTLGSNLQKAIQKGGLSEAISYCNINAYPLMDSVEEDFEAEIRRVSLKARNPNDKPDSLELQLLEAYHYNSENKLPLETNIQKVNDGKELLYTKPITINNAMCLQCHGKLGEAVDKAFYKLIKELYPDDMAVGYEYGDLRGMWSIRLTKSAIVKKQF